MTELQTMYEGSALERHRLAAELTQVRVELVAAKADAARERRARIAAEARVAALEPAAVSWYARTAPLNEPSSVKYIPSRPKVWPEIAFTATQAAALGAVIIAAYHWMMA